MLQNNKIYKQSNLFIYKVILDIPYIEGWYYLHAENIHIGNLVNVPVRNKICAGIIIEQINLESIKDLNIDIAKLKYVTQVSSIIFSQAWLNFMYFIANYYHESKGEVALSSLPNNIKQAKFWHQLSSFLPSTYILLHNHNIKVKTIEGKNLIKTLEHKACYLEELLEISPKAKIYLKKWNNYIIKQAYNIQIYTNLKFNLTHTLNQQQQKIVDDILSVINQYNTHLIHGITGSGKTAIYLTLIAKILKIKPHAQILILVPEINLTPQLIELIKSHFPNIPLAILNSNIADKQRAINWYQSYIGMAKIIIGTRLASMTMLPNLALIIIDEEHDTSYKQQEGVRYQARDILIWQARQLNIPLILSSATPSLETYYNSKINKYIYHELNIRATKVDLPNVNIINLENYQKNQMLGDIISPILAEKIHETIQKQEQVLLFLNRRGFALVMFCADCKYIFTCKNCSVNLVVHKNHNKLVCHHCGYNENIIACCPSCNSIKLLPIGTGTQKVEQTLIDYFSNYKILRVDSDNISQKGSLQHKLDLINSKQIDIIIATQMLSKGHDFKHVGMVGILNPDGMLYSYNMRSQEQLFCQLMQVIGRAGRHKQGQVYLQTMFSQHLLYKALQQHNYTAYADIMLKQRQELNLSPYNFEVQINASHHLEGQAFEQLTQLKHIIFPLNQQLKTGCFISPITHHNIIKYKNMHRAYFIIECNNRKSLHTFLNNIMPYLHKLKSNWYIEILP